MKRFLAFFLSLLLASGFVARAEETEEPQSLYAQAAVLMDADSGRVLFEKNGDEILAMASTTKIMTCIIALENGDLEDEVIVSSNASAQPKVHLGMQTDERFVLKDLLYSLMLESHNDSAVAIAEHIAGSVEEFAHLMNQKAKEIGCSDTYYITPNGLDAVDTKGSHSTTATDLARVMKYCITKSPMKDMFLKITGTPNYSFSDVAKKRSFSCTNHNSFLNMMDGAISGKTGFTGKAGYCYVGAVKRGERTFVVALLACGWPNNKNYKWKDTTELMEYAIENYEYREVDEHIELPNIEVVGGIPTCDKLFEKAFVKLEMKCSDDISFLRRKDEKIRVEIICKELLKAPIKKGDIVGKVIFSLDDMTLQESSIVVSETVNKRDVSWVFTHIMEMYLGI